MMGVLAVVGRLRRVLSALVRSHLAVAQAEGSREAERLVRGLVLYVVAVVALSCGALGFQVCAVVALQDQGWSLAQGLAVVGVADGAIGLLALWRGRVALRGPWMEDTRTLLVRTSEALLD